MRTRSLRKQIQRLTALVGFTTALTITPHASAQGNQADIHTMDNRARAILAAMKDNPPKIIHSFDGPAGMRGHVLQGKPSEAKILVWQTPDGYHLMMGNLYDHAGRDLTGLAAEHHDAENPLALAVKMALDIDTAIQSAAQSSQGSEASANASSEQADYYSVGVPEVVDEFKHAILDLPSGNQVPWLSSDESDAAKHHMYLFVDPFCPYCHKLLQGIRDVDFKGAQIRVRLIPVSLLGEASNHAAARALANRDTLEAIAMLQGENVNIKQEATALQYAAIEKNHEVMVTTTMEGTPTLLFVFNAGSDQEAASAFIGMNADDISRTFSGLGVDLETQP
ncbi:thioredoxin fold domain-containing protein [Marinobacterium sp. BA1]|uniref:thioredoxin fold domain-containing protein n=1 Tax=Marinobacterium sp. BA1 TaxID=3138931 RepID=UPI0032E5655F